MSHELKIKEDTILRKSQTPSIEVTDDYYALTLALLELADSIRQLRVKL